MRRAVPQPFDEITISAIAFFVDATPAVRELMCV
jgi:hypothetical protein